MDRRKALRNLGILTSGIVLLPSCDFSEEKISLVLNKLSITTSQEELMKELVATILPEGEIAGAGTLMVHDFVWIMVDDCLEPALQESYLKGLSGFNKDFKNVDGKSFLSSNQEDRVNTLNLIETSKENTTEKTNEDFLNFIDITKRFAILGYMQSEYMMTDIMPYRLIPGTYGPCETIDNTKRVNVNA